MSNKKLQLSIVVPFYNEEKNILLVLKNYKKIKTDVQFELLCINNGSRDNSQKIFNKLLKQKKYAFAKLVIIKDNIGYGDGIVRGLEKAKGEVVAWTHADMQTDARDVFRAYKKYKQFENSKIVVKGYRVKRSVSSVVFSFGMATIASILLGKIFYEINAQPKLFHRSFLKYFRNPPNDFSLDLYFLLVCKKYHYKIISIPVKFSERKYGESKWNYSFKSRWKTIRRTINYILILHQTEV